MTLRLVIPGYSLRHQNKWTSVKDLCFPKTKDTRGSWANLIIKIWNRLFKERINAELHNITAGWITMVREVLSNSQVIPFTWCLLYMLLRSRNYYFRGSWDFKSFFWFLVEWTGKLQKNVPSSKDKISHRKFLMVKLIAIYVRILKSTKL